MVPGIVQEQVDRPLAGTCPARAQAGKPGSVRTGLFNVTHQGFAVFQADRTAARARGNRHLGRLKAPPEAGEFASLGGTGSTADHQVIALTSPFWLGTRVPRPRSEMRRIRKVLRLRAELASNLSAIATGARLAPRWPVEGFDEFRISGWCIGRICGLWCASFTTRDTDALLRW